MPVATGMVYPDRFLAMDSGMTTGKVPGVRTKDPAFGTPALWIEPQVRDQAELHGYTVVEPGSVLATHLTAAVREHADEILTRDATKHLIDELKQTSPAVVDELIPGVMKLAEVQQILQMLLREQVPIRQLGLILETLGDYAPRIKDPILLTEYVRNRLARTICDDVSRPGQPAVRGDARPGAGGSDSRRFRAQRAGAVHPDVAAGGRDDVPADRGRDREARGWRTIRRSCWSVRRFGRRCGR